MNKQYLALFFALALIAAACGGSTEEAADEVEEAVTTEAPVEEAVEETTTEAVVETEPEPAGPVDGQTVYEENCSRCHGDDGSGGRGPSLQGIAVEQPDTAVGITQVTDGGGGMPAFGNTLSPEQIEAAVDYIWTTF